MRIAAPSGDQRLDVLRRSIEVRLERDADARGLRARALEQRDRRIDVRRALHVDPEEVLVLLGARHEPVEVPLAQRRIEIEAELRRLDRDVRVEPGCGHAIEHVEIVQGDLLGFLDVRQVFSELRQDRGDALRLELPGGPQRVVDLFPRHEPRNRPAHDRAFRGMLTQPRIGGAREQRLPHQGHGISRDRSGTVTGRSGSLRRRPGRSLQSCTPPRQRAGTRRPVRTRAPSPYRPSGNRGDRSGPWTLRPRRPVSSR